MLDPYAEGSFPRPILPGQDESEEEAGS
jgi:hypothetical protein